MAYPMRPPKEARSTASYEKHNHSSPRGHQSGNHEGRELQQLGKMHQATLNMIFMRMTHLSIAALKES